MCILRLGENGLEKYRLAKKWEQFKIVLLFMDHPVGLVRLGLVRSGLVNMAAHVTPTIPVSGL